MSNKNFTQNFWIAWRHEKIRPHICPGSDPGGGVERNCAPCRRPQLYPARTLDGAESMGRQFDPASQQRRGHIDGNSFGNATRHRFRVVERIIVDDVQGCAPVALAVASCESGAASVRAGADIDFVAWLWNGIEGCDGESNYILSGDREFL